MTTPTEMPVSEVIARYEELLLSTRYDSERAQCRTILRALRAQQGHGEAMAWACILGDASVEKTFISHNDAKSHKDGMDRYGHDKSIIREIVPLTFAAPPSRDAVRDEVDEFDLRRELAAVDRFIATINDDSDPIVVANHFLRKIDILQELKSTSGEGKS